MRRCVSRVNEAILLRIAAGIRAFDCFATSAIDCSVSERATSRFCRALAVNWSPTFVHFSLSPVFVPSMRRCFVVGVKNSSYSRNARVELRPRLSPSAVKLTRPNRSGRRSHTRRQIGVVRITSARRTPSSTARAYLKILTRTSLGRQRILICDCGRKYCEDDHTKHPQNPARRPISPSASSCPTTLHDAATDPL